MRVVGDELVKKLETCCSLLQNELLEIFGEIKDGSNVEE